MSADAPHCRESRLTPGHVAHNIGNTPWPRKVTKVSKIFCRIQPRWVALPALLVFSLATAGVARPQSVTISAAPAPAFSLEGVPNVGQVNSLLYRGGQPGRSGYEALKKLGIQIVVNLRDESGEIESERRTVEGLGMRYVSMPWNPFSRPTNQQVGAFLQLLGASPGQKIFVHCHEGKDRTGVVIAAYRMTYEKWAPEKAILEMYAYHYHHFLLPQMQSYVQTFPKQLTEDSGLRAILAAVSAAAPALPAAAVPIH
jgi:tyrosine-protein phosphatase SIW14